MVDLAQLVGSTQVREARFAPATIDETSRTVELVWTTGATVRRRSWLGERFDEELVVSAKAVRLGRLNNGANLLDSHRAFGLDGVVGVVERAWLTGTEGRATVRFSDREDVEPIWRDVRSGIIRNISVGYDIHRAEKIERKDENIPLIRITDWEPLELSLVAVPADAGAQTRSGATARTRTMDIEQNTAAAPAAAVADGSRAPGANMPTSQPGGGADPAGDALRAAVADVRRVHQACRLARIDTSVGDQLLERMSPDAACRELLDRAAQREEVDAVFTRHVTGGADYSDPAHVRTAMSDALAARLSGGVYQLPEPARPFRGMSVVDMARDVLEARGVPARRLRPLEIITRAHTTSDFPLILADSANKALQVAYMAAPAALKQIARETNAHDFKDQYRLRIGSFPSLLQVNEHGEYEQGTVSEEREVFALAKFGRIFAVSFEAMVNDDLNAFSEQVFMVANAVTSLEADKLAAVLTSNPQMGDGTALFHANHGNLVTSGSGAPSVANVGAGRAMMRKQTALDGTTVLNIAPAFLITPAALETAAEQFLADISAAKAEDAPVFAGRLTSVTEARLDATSETAWYLAATTSAMPGLNYAYLDGFNGPTVEVKEGFEMDATMIKCRHIFAAFAQDWRGLFRDDGVNGG